MTQHPQSSTTTTTLSARPDEAIEAIKQALQTLKYGAIALTIHDAKVVQLEVTEKRRFAP